MSSAIAKRCLLAIMEHRKKRMEDESAIEPKQILSSDDLQNSNAIDGLSGQSVAEAFTQQACCSLDRRQIEHLVHFWAAPRHPMSRSSKKQRQDDLSRRLNEFYQTESLQTRWPINQLATPSGPVDAELGIILHCQSKEGDAGQSWDESNQTIRALMKKGLNDHHDFCYDWHWRSEENFRRGGLCPTVNWPDDVKALHNELSSDILSIINFRFLLIGGSCAKQHYRRCVPSVDRCTISVPIITGEYLEFDLEFSREALLRIVTYVNHPSAIYFNKIGKGTSMRLDAGCNFVLWLLGRKHDPNSMRTICSGPRYNLSRGAAPISELRRYKRIENETGRQLSLEEYDESFLTWANKLLGDNYHTLLQNGDSIAEACATEMDSRAVHGQKRAYDSLGLDSTYEAHRSQTNRELNYKRYDCLIREFWNGESVKVPQNGTIRIFISPSKPALRLQVGRKIVESMVEVQKDHATIKFYKEGITLELDGKVIHTKSAAKLFKRKDGKDWELQMTKELEHMSSNGLS